VAEFLDFLLPGRIAELEVRQMLYSQMCNKTGGGIDDTVVYRLDRCEYLANSERGTICQIIQS
tara:strand:+ start:128 stop:316 length:189 start_codon:yes stop_codon:yes gene_type:complete